jgi:hypothetical protein
MRVRVLCVLALVLATGAGGCKKKKPAPGPDVTPEPAPAGATPTNRGDGQPSGGAPIPAGFARGGNTNFVAGGGAVQNVRQAGRRTVAINDFHQLGIAIKQVELEDNRMPDVARIKAEVRTFPNVPQAIEEGVIILTGSRDPSGLWAYEVDADTKGGIVLVGGSASRASADEVRRLLGALPRPVAPPQPAPVPMGKIDNRPAPPVQPQPTPGPAVAVTQQDMEDVRIFIDNASGASGQMPTPQLTYGALQQGSPKTAALVQKGAIILTGARTREGIWAYEAAALQRGGLATGSNGTETLTADALRRRLGGR